MDPENFVQPEVGVAVALTTLLLHPLPRQIVRRTLVLGLSAALGIASALKGHTSSTQKGPGPLAALLRDAQDIRHKGRP